MAFASSLFCSSKFLEHTYTLTKRITVLACSDNTKDVAYVPLPFSIFGSFYPVRFFFYVKILVGDIEGGAKKTLSSKNKTQFLFCFFFAGRSFLCPLLSGALGDRLYRL